uniref:Sterol O-acyltransferase 1 n=1 Tax=Chinchilla lanigera TaxID=34839 RepID=A0A8C2VWN1_CHILA
MSKASENLEKDEDQRNFPEENGRIDIKQLIAKKRQLTAEAEQLKPLFLKEVGSHFDDIVTSLIEKSASLDNGGCAPTTFSILEEMKNNHRTKDMRAPPEQGKIFISRRSLLDELFEVDHIRTIYHMFIAILIIFILSTLVLGILGVGPTYVVLAYALPPASRLIIILEQIRMIMKAHSFVRENVPRVLNAAKEKSSTVPVPTVNQYLYFLFAPTLIYRDSYPRTPTIRWSYVVLQFAQVFGCIFYLYYIFERLCVPLFGTIKQEPFSARVLVLCVFNSILPGVLMMFLSFFAFLHCWLNAFAEMLRFGDRMFYKDWWNSTSYSNYYRTWNVVVHDWLYYYGVLVCFYSQEWYARQHCPLKNPTFLDYLRPRSWTCRYVF